MKKIVLGLLLVASVVMAVPAPAQAADEYDSRINYHNRGPSGHEDDGKVRLSVWYNVDNDGQGYVIKRVRVDCWPDFAFEQTGIKVNGGSVTLQTGENEIIFQRSDVDLGQDCEQNWYPDISRHNRSVFRAAYDYTARLNAWPDANDKLIMNCPCAGV